MLYVNCRAETHDGAEPIPFTIVVPADDPETAESIVRGVLMGLFTMIDCDEPVDVGKAQLMLLREDTV